MKTIKMRANARNVERFTQGDPMLIPAYLEPELCDNVELDCGSEGFFHFFIKELRSTLEINGAGWLATLVPGRAASAPTLQDLLEAHFAGQLPDWHKPLGGLRGQPDIGGDPATGLAGALAESEANRTMLSQQVVELTQRLHATEESNRRWAIRYAEDRKHQDALQDELFRLREATASTLEFEVDGETHMFYGNAVSVAWLQNIVTRASVASRHLKGIDRLLD